MRTIRVDNIPSDLYKALRARARKGKRSMSAEVLLLLEDNIPTEGESRRRQDFYRKALRMQKRKQPAGRIFLSTEDILREDRSR